MIDLKELNRQAPLDSQAAIAYWESRIILLIRSFIESMPPAMRQEFDKQREILSQKTYAANPQIQLLDGLDNWNVILQAAQMTIAKQKPATPAASQLQPPAPQKPQFIRISEIIKNGDAYREQTSKQAVGIVREKIRKILEGLGLASMLDSFQDDLQQAQQEIKNIL